MARVLSGPKYTAFCYCTSNIDNHSHLLLKSGVVANIKSPSYVLRVLRRDFRSSPLLRALFHSCTFKPANLVTILPARRMSGSDVELAPDLSQLHFTFALTLVKSKPASLDLDGKLPARIEMAKSLTTFRVPR